MEVPAFGAGKESRLTRIEAPEGRGITVAQAVRPGRAFRLESEPRRGGTSILCSAQKDPEVNFKTNPTEALGLHGWDL